MIHGSRATAAELARVAPRWLGALLAGALAWLPATGCGDGDDRSNTSEAVPVAGAAGAPMADSGSGAAAAGTAGTAAEDDSGCAVSCRESEVCLLGVCVDDCDDRSDLASIAEGLAHGVRLVARVCGDGSVVDTGREPTSGRVVAYELTSTPVPVGSVLELRRWLIEATMTRPESQVVGQHTVFSADPVYPSDFAVLAEGLYGVGVALGYTTGAAGFPGRLVLIGPETASLSIEAAANHDLVAVEQDAWLLATSEFGGRQQAALYWVRRLGGVLISAPVATGFGVFSGSVALAPDRNTVFVGGYSAEGPRVYAVPLTALRNAADGIEGVLDLQGRDDVSSVQASSSRFDVLSDGRLLLKYQTEGGHELLIDVARPSAEPGQFALVNTSQLARSAELHGAFPAGEHVLLSWASSRTLVAGGE